MSNLKSYIEKYLLYPEKTIEQNLDDLEDEETRAVVTKKIKDPEIYKGIFSSVSKLRLKNAELLEDKDPRYKGKQTSRKAIEGTSDISFDPDLAKYLMLHNDENENDDDDELDLEQEKCTDSEASIENFDDEGGELESEHEESFGDENTETDDYMMMAEEVEEEEDSEEEDKNDFKEKELDNLGHKSAKRKYINEEKKSSIVMKGKAVKCQCSTYDSLFEARIGLQKVTSIANQLPQYQMYEKFVKSENYPQYKSNLIVARKMMKKVIKQLLELQEFMFSSYADTVHLADQDKSGSNSSDGETNDNETSIKLKKNPTGNKRKMEEFEELLKKRHKGLQEFQNQTLNEWYEKSKLLATQNRKSFQNFEVPPVQQIQNILANKDDLIKRTRLISTSRGNINRILGKPDNSKDSLEDHYDPEIFDDTDFYSRTLEGVLKSKISISDDMTEVSRRWIDIQKLRKKAKKTVDTKASKGRKIRYEVMSKLPQFLAPCKPSQMDDDATNRLFSSLFGRTAPLKAYSNAIK